MKASYEQYLEADPNLTNPAYAYWTRKLQACVFAEDYASALDAAVKAQGMLAGPSPVERAEYHFYAALARAGSVDTPEDLQSDWQTTHRDALTAHHQQLQIWAEYCPENFENRAALVGAELARLEGRDLDAERLYEQAIRSARVNGFVHNEALACETAARFYAARGFEDVAEMYLERARDGYLRWGADGKVRQLEARYPQLAMAEPRRGTREATSPDHQLDVAAVVKASQALSSEMLLPRLIERLMTIAVQNAGADRGLLILPHENEYRIEAEARADGEQIVLHYGAPAGPPAVPEAIIRYVMRTQESVILDDAAKHNLFSEDPYVRLRRQRSILCLPLIRQGNWSDCFTWRTRWRRTSSRRIVRGCSSFWRHKRRSRWRIRVSMAISRNARRRFDAWSTPTSSEYAFSTLTVVSWRPTTRFSASWDTAATM